MALVAMTISLAGGSGGFEAQPTKATIGPSGGTITCEGGLLTLQVPEGALSRDRELSCRPAPAADLPDPLDDLAGPGDVYKLEPPGVIFDAPARVAMLTDAPAPDDRPATVEGSVLLAISEDGSVEALANRSTIGSPQGTWAMGELDHFTWVVRVPTGLELEVSPANVGLPAYSLFNVRATLRNTGIEVIPGELLPEPGVPTIQVDGILATGDGAVVHAVDPSPTPRLLGNDLDPGDAITETLLYRCDVGAGTYSVIVEHTLPLIREIPGLWGNYLIFRGWTQSPPDVAIHGGLTPRTVAGQPGPGPLTGGNAFCTVPAPDSMLQPGGEMVPRGALNQSRDRAIEAVITEGDGARVPVGDTVDLGIKIQNPTGASRFDLSVDLANIRVETWAEPHVRVENPTFRLPDIGPDGTWTTTVGLTCLEPGPSSVRVRIHSDARLPSSVGGGIVEESDLGGRLTLYGIIVCVEASDAEDGTFDPDDPVYRDPDGDDGSDIEIGDIRLTPPASGNKTTDGKKDRTDCIFEGQKAAWKAVYISSAGRVWDAGTVTWTSSAFGIKEEADVFSFTPGKPGNGTVTLSDGRGNATSFPLTVEAMPLDPDAYEVLQKVPASDGTLVELASPPEDASGEPRYTRAYLQQGGERAFVVWLGDGSKAPTGETDPAWPHQVTVGVDEGPVWLPGAARQVVEAAQGSVLFEQVHARCPEK